MLHVRQILLMLIIGPLLVSLGGCSSQQIPSTYNRAPREGQTLITTYLSTSGSAFNQITFDLEQVALFQNQTWIELALPSVEIDSKANHRNQMLLGVGLAPSGEYRRLKLGLNNLKVDGELVTSEGKLEIVELNLPEPLYLKNKDSQCLFIDWTQEDLQEPKIAFRPRFTAWGQQVQLGTGLAYIACRDMGTIYVLRTDTNDVVGSFAVPGPIGDIEVDPTSRQLYVMSSGSRYIYRYDCVKARLLEQIFLPRTVAPKHFALDLDGPSAYVSDTSSGLVLKVDLTAGTVLAQQQVGHRPEKIVILPVGSKRVAVVSPKTQQISIFETDSLTLLRTFSIGQQVTDLKFINEQLYVVEQSTNRVIIYEYQTGRLLTRIAVGFKPFELLVADAQSFYVSNQGEASLSVLISGHETSFRRIPAGSTPTDLAFSSRHQSIYVLSPKMRTVSVVSLPDELLSKSIPLGGTPTAISVLD